MALFALAEVTRKRQLTGGLTYRPVEPKPPLPRGASN